jgi:hypothetical protein
LNPPRIPLERVTVEDNPLLGAVVWVPMTPPKEAEPALAAPGVGDLLATPSSKLTGPRENRRSRSRPYSHVHLELDLAPTPKDPSGEPLLEQLSGLLNERKVVEKGTLILLGAAALHALTARQFRRIEHWEVSPGGSLVLPEGKPSVEEGEPVGVLIKALESGAWESIAKARSFSAQLSGPSGAKVEFTIRRVHRESRHALTVDLRGTWTKATVQDVIASLSSRLPVTRSTMTKFMYA